MLQSKINGTQTSVFTKFGGKLSFSSCLSLFMSASTAATYIFHCWFRPPPPTTKPEPNRVFLCKVTAEDTGEFPK